MNIIQFAPLPSGPFTFPLTRQGRPYSGVVGWSLSGQRRYLSVSSAQGALVAATPLVGSPPGFDIDLLSGRFLPSTLVFRETTNQFEVGP
jgi:hypothetical protein